MKEIIGIVIEDDNVLKYIFRSNEEELNKFIVKVNQRNDEEEDDMHDLATKELVLDALENINTNRSLKSSHLETYDHFLGAFHDTICDYHGRCLNSNREEVRITIIPMNKNDSYEGFDKNTSYCVVGITTRTMGNKGVKAWTKEDRVYDLFPGGSRVYSLECSVSEMIDFFKEEKLIKDDNEVKIFVVD